MTELVVVTGIGGMGSACARRLAQGRTLVLLDIDVARLEQEAEALGRAGFDVVAEQADVADREAVAAFAARTAARGSIRALMHTAGISGSMAGSERILAVNLAGTAHIIEAFEPLMAPGAAAVMIASMGSISVPIDPAIERRLAHAPADELVGIVQAIRRFHPIEAYCVSKRAVQLRVYAASIPWGKRGLRINAISPGIIATPMGELEARNVPAMAIMREIAAVRRIGQPEDIAAAAEFLLGPNASFVTGTDLAVDGGVIAAQLWGPVQAF